MNDFFDIFDMFITEEAPADKPAAKKEISKPTTAPKKAVAEKTLSVDKLKRIKMLSKEVKVGKNVFPKKTVKISEVVRYFAAQIGFPKPEVLTGVFTNDGTVYVAYKLDEVLSKDAMLPESFVGYTFLGKNCEYHLYGAANVEGIRNGLDVSDSEYKDDAYGFILIKDAECIVPVLIPKPFAIPATDSVTVMVDGKEETLTFAKADEKKPEQGAVKMDEEDSDDEADGEASKEFTEITSEEIAKELSKVLKHSYVNVVKVGDKLVAIPTLEPVSSGKKVTASAPKEVKVPITDKLCIEFGYGSILLKDCPELEGKTEVTMAEALKILQARKPQYQKIKKMEYFAEQEMFYPDYPTSTKGVDVTDDMGHFQLGRIPYELVDEMFYHFEEDAAEGNESAAAFLYDTRTGSWRVSFPTQSVTPVSVTCNYGEDAQIPYEIVAIQCHSHHRMRCSFSSIDDRDEQFEGPVFAVCHSMEETDFGGIWSIDCRINRSGRFISVNPEEVFTLPDYVR